MKEYLQAFRFRTMVCAVCAVCSIALFSFDMLGRGRDADELPCPSVFRECLLHALERDLVSVWYPRVVDEEFGGFLTRFNENWEPDELQDKMLVTQTRHVWTTIYLYAHGANWKWLRPIAEHGLKFVLEHMKDNGAGGYFWLVEQDGTLSETECSRLKQVYGIAFVVYALSEFAQATGYTEILEEAVEVFHWLERHAHDPVHGGYYQFVDENGFPWHDSSLHRYAKDQNTTIHLLEAFSVLYRVWQDALLLERIRELKSLIYHRMSAPEGYIHLFFEEDWTPVSLSHLDPDSYDAMKYFDHVSFGHDVEIAFLLYEAAIAIDEDPQESALPFGKRFLDHALRWGWDETEGGIFDGGYYRDGEMVIVDDRKAWWAQAELLNTLILMAKYDAVDGDHYYQKAWRTWQYIERNLVDHERGGWWMEGVDRRPSARHAPKSTHWKAAYHNVRALVHSAVVLQTVARQGG